MLTFYLSSSSPVGHKATTTFLHRVLSFAAARTSPHESPTSCSSAITVFRHVVCGRPGFLLAGGVHLRATLGILSLGIHKTCPSHLSRQRLICRTALLQPVFLWSSTVDILLGQIIRQIFLKHPLWKASIFAMSHLTTRQHSEPYSKIDFTLLSWYTAWISNCSDVCQKHSGLFPVLL